MTMIYLFSVSLTEILTHFLVLSLGWSCKGSDSSVTSLEAVTVGPGRKTRENWKQNGEEQETDESWQKKKEIDKPGSCDLQYNERNNRHNTTNSISSEKKFGSYTFHCED